MKQTPKNKTTFRYEYYLKDHLGNVRFLFSDVDGDGVPEILQEDAYDPWGVRLAGLSYTQGERNGFLYNGKEQVKGLGWYDYGFRWYMPDVGRFLGADPLAEKFPWLTTYQYASNNPVLNIDLDGLEGIKSFAVYDGEGTGVMEDIEVLGKNPHNSPLTQARVLSEAGYEKELNSEQRSALEHYRNGTGLNVESPFPQLEANLEVYAKVTFGPREANSLKFFSGSDINLGSHTIADFSLTANAREQGVTTNTSFLPGGFSSGFEVSRTNITLSGLIDKNNNGDSQALSFSAGDAKALGIGADVSYFANNFKKDDLQVNFNLINMGYKGGKYLVFDGGAKLSFPLINKKNILLHNETK